MTTPESPLSASLPTSDGRSGEIPSSSHLGACGHELDPWETHLEHHPTCAASQWTAGCMDTMCTCPEVCPDCCRSCDFDLAERMGS